MPSTFPLSLISRRSRRVAEECDEDEWPWVRANAKAALSVGLQERILEQAWLTPQSINDRIAFMTTTSLVNRTWLCIYLVVTSRDIYIITPSYARYLLDFYERRTPLTMSWLTYASLLPLALCRSMRYCLPLTPRDDASESFYARDTSPHIANLHYFVQILQTPLGPMDPKQQRQWRLEFCLDMVTLFGMHMNALTMSRSVVWDAANARLLPVFHAMQLVDEESRNTANRVSGDLVRTQVMWDLYYKPIPFATQASRSADVAHSRIYAARILMGHYVQKARLRSPFKDMPFPSDVYHSKVLAAKRLSVSLLLAIKQGPSSASAASGRMAVEGSISFSLPAEMLENIIEAAWLLPQTIDERVSFMTVSLLVSRGWLRSYIRVSSRDIYVPTWRYAQYLLRFHDAQTPLSQLYPDLARLPALLCRSLKFRKPFCATNDPSERFYIRHPYPHVAALRFLTVLITPPPLWLAPFDRLAWTVVQTRKIQHNIWVLRKSVEINKLKELQQLDDMTKDMFDWLWKPSIHLPLLHAANLAGTERRACNKIYERDTSKNRMGGSGSWIPHESAFEIDWASFTTFRCKPVGVRKSEKQTRKIKKMMFSYCRDAFNEGLRTV